MVFMALELWVPGKVTSLRERGKQELQAAVVIALPCGMLVLLLLALLCTYTVV